MAARAVPQARVGEDAAAGSGIRGAVQSLEPSIQFLRGRPPLSNRFAHEPGDEVARSRFAPGQLFELRLVLGAERRIDQRAQSFITQDSVALCSPRKQIAESLLW